MKIKLNNFSFTFIREKGDPKFYGRGGGKGESNFLHYIKTELNKKGFNLIKKRMWKDGHLVDDLQQYLRVANKKSKAPHIQLYNNTWALSGLEEHWNKGEVNVYVDFDIYGVQPDCKEMVAKLLEPSQVSLNFTVSK